jgi:hypothetical protein
MTNAEVYQKLSIFVAPASHGTKPNGQTRNSGGGNRKSSLSIQCKAGSIVTSPNVRLLRCSRAKSDQTQKSRFQIAKQRRTIWRVRISRSQKKSKIPFENEAATQTQRASLGTRGRKAKMIGLSLLLAGIEVLTFTND